MLKKPDGTILTENIQISSFVTDFYEEFHKRGPSVACLGVLSAIPPVISEEDNIFLTAIPSREEIKAVVFYLDPDSAPGPNGFPRAFFKHCWKIIERDVCRAIMSFFREGIITKGVNNNFITLIPKVDEPVTLDKFRPICLGNFLYKLIPKILATRLSGFLPKLISDEQGAFQKGKVIFSNICAASELKNMMHVKSYGGGMGLKLDIQKAYDTMEWEFMFDVMRKFGFCVSWVNMIHQLLSSAKLSILLNGGPVGFFGVERGLRQGDPLAPLLFIIAEEALCRGFTKLKEERKISPLPGPRGVVVPTHLLFADDVFLFVKAGTRSVRSLKKFLEEYHEYSGQCINIHKSKMFLCNVSAIRRGKIKDIVGFPKSSFPTRYLGIEIFKGRVKKDAISTLMDKFKARLAGWKGKLISMAGRVQLVKSVPSSMPIHTFSVYWWPTSLITLMERWMRNFIWCGDSDVSKGITVRWEWVCKPYEEGGLGIKKLREVNKALLCKLCWAIKVEQSLISNFLRARFTSKEHPELQGWENWLKAFHSPLASFISNSKWNFLVVDSPVLQQIINLASSIPFPTILEEDTRVWTLTKQGDFTVKLTWEGLRRSENQIAWHEVVWASYLQPRHSMLGWRLMQQKLPTDETGFLCLFQRTWLAKESMHEFIVWWKEKAGSSAIPKDRRIREVQWRKPDEHWMKLNIDGYSIGNPGNSSAVGILRNYEGEPKGSFAQFLGVSTNFIAEILTFFLGVKMAKEKGIQRLWIESDAQAVVTSIRSSKILWLFKQSWLEVAGYLKDIRWTITHSYKEANAVADILVKRRWPIKPGEVALYEIAFKYGFRFPNGSGRERESLLSALVFEEARLKVELAEERKKKAAKKAKAKATSKARKGKALAVPSPMDTIVDLEAEKNKGDLSPSKKELKRKEKEDLSPPKKDKRPKLSFNVKGTNPPGVSSGSGMAGLVLGRASSSNLLIRPVWHLFQGDLALTSSAHAREWLDAGYLPIDKAMLSDLSDTEIFSMLFQDMAMGFSKAVEAALWLESVV
ncbi:uncharacterized protein LOC122651645 [Telopea speciosissima]|uniref:uncharacterized protein LOC122651645 n=1 Tax=Telopea speciosissima TaxID=54955 RepID=UPI001CC757D2|nr:uncharacterized protein LOC122651645 [Telopea speciosissima]